MGQRILDQRRGYGEAIRVRSLPHEQVDRAVTEHDTDGVTRVVLDRAGRVLGATIIAPRAGEMITELAILVARKGRLRDLASVAHPYPSWSQAVWNLAVAESTAELHRPPRRWVITLLRWLRR